MCTNENFFNSILLNTCWGLLLRVWPCLRLQVVGWVIRNWAEVQLRNLDLIAVGLLLCSCSVLPCPAEAFSPKTWQLERMLSLRSVDQSSSSDWQRTRVLHRGQDCSSSGSVEHLRIIAVLFAVGPGDSMFNSLPCLVHSIHAIWQQSGYTF